MYLNWTQRTAQRGVHCRAAALQDKGGAFLKTQGRTQAHIAPGCPSACTRLLLHRDAMPLFVASARNASPSRARSRGEARQALWRGPACVCRARCAEGPGVCAGGHAPGRAGAGKASCPQLLPATPGAALAPAANGLGRVRARPLPAAAARAADGRRAPRPRPARVGGGVQARGSEGGGPNALKISERRVVNKKVNVSARHTKRARPASERDPPAPSPPGELVRGFPQHRCCFQ